MANEPVFCPNCDAQDSLSPFVYDRAIEYEGETITVSGLEANTCAVCGGDPVLDEQIRRNRARYVDAKRRADGLLTGEDIVAIRSLLRLTQAEAAFLFGGGANAFSKYERGEVTQSVAMDRLMRIATDVPGAESWLRGAAGMKSREVESQAYGDRSDNVIDLAEYRSVKGWPVVPDAHYEQQL